MKKLFLISAALLAAISSAQSADLQRVYTKAPMAAVSSWTGFYAGVNLGYGFNDPTATFSPNQAAAAFVVPGAIPVLSYDVKGVIGGGQIGYNWQLSQNWLVGLEADFQGSDVKGSASTNFTSGAAPYFLSAQQNVEWFGTVRARAGWLPNDRLLVFGTGGLAYGSVRNTVGLGPSALGGNAAGSGGFSVDCGSNLVGIGNACFSGDGAKIQTGYAVGAGFEYAAWQNVTFKVEYLYVNLGSRDTTASAIVVAPGTLPASMNVHFSDLDFNVVRVGANWRF